MYICMKIAELIIRRKMNFDEIADEIIKYNVRVILTKWGYPELAE